jgi:hypothetical protein
MTNDQTDVLNVLVWMPRADRGVNYPLTYYLLVGSFPDKQMGEVIAEVRYDTCVRAWLAQAGTSPSFKSFFYASAAFMYIEEMYASPDTAVYHAEDYILNDDEVMMKARNEEKQEFQLFLDLMFNLANPASRKALLDGTKVLPTSNPLFKPVIGNVGNSMLTRDAALDWLKEVQEKAVDTKTVTDNRGSLPDKKSLPNKKDS